MPKQLLRATKGARYRMPRRFSLSIVTSSLLIATLPPACFGGTPSNHSVNQKFVLTNGRGVPVCEAYLELLNKTHFRVTPFCGRPDYGAVAGFENLQRSFMGAEDILPLLPSIYEFFHFDQSLDLRAYTLVDLRAAMDDRVLRVWTYLKPVDIENNGGSDRVVIWRGLGVSDHDDRCGEPFTRHPWRNTYADQRPLLLTPDGKGIDARQTRKVFSTGVVNAVLMDEGASFNAKRTDYPMADAVDIFEFDHRFYIQTENAPATMDAQLPAVHVFIREAAHTKLMCSMRPVNVPRPY